MIRIFEVFARAIGLRTSRPADCSVKAYLSPSASSHASPTSICYPVDRNQARRVCVMYPAGGSAPYGSEMASTAKEIDVSATGIFIRILSSRRCRVKAIIPDLPIGAIPVPSACRPNNPSSIPADSRRRTPPITLLRTGRHYTTQTARFGSTPVRTAGWNPAGPRPEGGFRPGVITPLTTAAGDLKSEISNLKSQISGPPSCTTPGPFSLASSPSAQRSWICLPSSPREVHPYNHQSTIINRKSSGLRPRQGLASSPSAAHGLIVPSLDGPIHRPRIGSGSLQCCLSGSLPAVFESVTCGTDVTMLKNYTSEVPAIQSVAYIEAKLVQFGATDILKKYAEDKKLIGISFIIVVGGVEVPFRLPARLAECEEVLFRTIRRPRPDSRRLCRQQAERTAWKILADWVDAQMAMTELAQVSLMEVMLPYVFNPSTQQTLFESLKATDFKALLPAACAAEAKSPSGV